MSWPEVAPDEVAWIGAATMGEIDRLTIDEAGITLVQMMENAGRSLATVVRAEMEPASVLVLVGSGGNGGGGLVAARHLLNAAVDVRVLLTSSRSRMSPVAEQQLAIVEWLGIEVTEAGPSFAVDSDVVLDAMVGYSLRGVLSGHALRVAEQVAASKAAVVSLDVPSGLSADGVLGGGCVGADATVSLCLPKVGLAGREEVGRLYLADISVPAQIVEVVTGGPSPPFDRGPILLVR